MAKEKIIEEELEEYDPDEEVLESLLEGDSENEEESEELEEESRLNSKKILTLIGLGFVSFVIFLLFTFPLDEMVRSVLVETSRDSGIIIESKEIHFPIFGRKSFDSFSVQFSNGTVMKAEELSVSVSLPGLLNQRVDGDAEIGFFKYDGGDTSFQIKSISFPLRIASIEEKITKWNGEGEIEFSGGKFFDSVEIPMLGSLKGQEIRKGSIHFKIRSGKVLIEKGNIESSIAKIQFQGVIRLSDVMNLSQLDLKVCATLNEKFALERQDIAGLATLLPQENGKICVPIRGSISSPKVDIPNLNQFGSPTGIQTEATTPGTDSGNPTSVTPAN
ncbi:type II secretion system protein GspN [Leptospira ognonensis]|uniref:Type II secretion system protein GspN n=1 Tax=Leptospira ognonensis TaxID=2484945 RepID=A0A4R9JYY6_9LEPT|nr:type II secretion system protein GspN [Leptospira ognonensis]TGL57431.1 type II secretion system protein GspN [Leptospira ognonensis]